MATQYRGLPAERLHRIWRLAEHIAERPGQSRAELADTFCLSERQTQADINVIRTTFGLPLLRSRGYRFAGDGPSVASGLTLNEAQTLLTILQRARRDPSIPPEQVTAIRDRLVLLFPVHLQAIVASTLAVLDAPRPTPLQTVLLAVLHAILGGTWIKLIRPHGADDPIIHPEVLLPFFGGWYVLGEGHRRHRIVGYRLADVEAVATMVIDQHTIQVARAASAAAG